MRDETTAAHFETKLAPLPQLKTQLWPLATFSNLSARIHCLMVFPAALHRKENIWSPSPKNTSRRAAPSVWLLCSILHCDINLVPLSHRSRWICAGDNAAYGIYTHLRFSHLHLRFFRSTRTTRREYLQFDMSAASVGKETPQARSSRSPLALIFLQSRVEAHMSKYIKQAVQASFRGYQRWCDTQPKIKARRSLSLPNIYRSASTRRSNGASSAR